MIAMIATDAIAASAGQSTIEHDMLIRLLEARFGDLYFWFALVISLILASFVFTAGSYVYTWVTGRQVRDEMRGYAEALDRLETNHIKHLKDEIEELKRKVTP